jgi:integrase
MADACTTAGLDPLGFHELRHSYASMLVNAGCPLAYVAAHLGHSDTRMVEKHYGHLAPNAMADSIRALMPKLGLTDAPKVAPLEIGGSAG